MKPLTFEIPYDTLKFISSNTQLAKDWQQKFTEGYLNGLKQFNEEVNNIKLFNPSNDLIVDRLIKIKEESEDNADNEIGRGISSLPAEVNMLKYGYHLAFYNESTKLLSMYDKIKVPAVGNSKPVSNKNKITNKAFKTFEWRVGDERLTYFYEELTKNLIIDELQTSLDSFKAIFNNSFEGPIYWKKSNKLFVYLMEAIQNHNRLKNPFIVESKYQSIVNKNSLVINSDGKPLTANDLSQAKSKNINEGLPEGYDLIDTIIELIDNYKVKPLNLS